MPALSNKRLEFDSDIYRWKTVSKLLSAYLERKRSVRNLMKHPPNGSSTNRALVGSTSIEEKSSWDLKFGITTVLPTSAYSIPPESLSVSSLQIHYTITYHLCRCRHTLGQFQRNWTFWTISALNLLVLNAKRSCPRFGQLFTRSFLRYGQTELPKFYLSLSLRVLEEKE